jgi:hypothetical protein
LPNGMISICRCTVSKKPDTSLWLDLRFRRKTLHLQIDISWGSGHRIPSEEDNDSV